MRLIFLLLSFPTLTMRRTILHVLVNFFKRMLKLKQSAQIYVFCSSVREVELSSTDAISTQDLFKPEAGLQLKDRLQSQECGTQSHTQLHKPVPTSRTLDGRHYQHT